MKLFLFLISIMFFSLPAVIKGQMTAVEYYNYGCDASDEGDYTVAITSYTYAIQLNPNYSDAYCNRGWAKCCLKDYSGSIIDFDKALQLNPTDDWAWNDRGVARWNLNDYDGACGDWNIAVKLGNTKAIENKREYCK